MRLDGKVAVVSGAGAESLAEKLRGRGADVVVLAPAHGMSQ